MTGTASIDQIVLAMKLYERRNTFIQRCLYALYNFSESDKLGPRSDVIEVRNVHFYFFKYFMSLITLYIKKINDLNNISVSHQPNEDVQKYF